MPFHQMDKTIFLQLISLMKVKVLINVLFKTIKCLNKIIIQKATILNKSTNKKTGSIQKNNLSTIIISLKIIKKIFKISNNQTQPKIMMHWQIIELPF